MNKVWDRNIPLATKFSCFAVTVLLASFSWYSDGRSSFRSFCNLAFFMTLIEM